MPIDPSIALSYKPVGLDIAGAMQAAEERKLLQSRNALAGAQQAAAQDELSNALAARRYAAGADLNDPQNAMRLMQYGETGAKMLQALQASRASAASARSTQGEYASKKADYYLNGVLPFARNKGKQGIISMLDMMRADPDLAGSPLASMPKEFADANLPDPQLQPNEYAQWEQRMGLGLSEFLKQSKPDINFQTTGRGVEGYDVNAYSPTYKQPVITAPAPPKSAGVQINMGDRAFGKSLGEGAGKEFTDMRTAATSAQDSYRSTNNLYPLVNNPDFISGAMGDWRAVAARQLGLPGVAATDTYFSQIGKEVGQEVKQFGAGTGISEGDRRYAAEIAGGSRAMNPETIRAIMYMRQMVNRYKIRKYNERRAFLDRNNPDANSAGLYEELPVPPPPAFNAQGWSLHQDKNGNYAYVSPDGKKVQEVQ